MVRCRFISLLKHVGWGGLHVIVGVMLFWYYCLDTNYFCLHQPTFSSYSIRLASCLISLSFWIGFVVGYIVVVKMLIRDWVGVFRNFMVVACNLLLHHIAKFPLALAWRWMDGWMDGGGGVATLVRVL